MDNLRNHHILLLSGVVCARTVGRLQAICFFIVLMLTIYGLWCFIYVWLMPMRVVDLLACWKGVMVDIALLIYGESFPRVLCGLFCGKETRQFLELKLFLLRSMYDWMATLSGHSFSSLEEFLNLCNF